MNLDKAKAQYMYTSTSLSWTYSCGFATCFKKLPLVFIIFSFTSATWQALLCLTDPYLNVSGMTFSVFSPVLFTLIHPSTCFSFQYAVFLSAFCLFSCSLRLGLPVSDNVSVYEHRPSKDKKKKKEEFAQKNPQCVLDLKFSKRKGTLDNQQVLKILFASKMALELFYSHKHTLAQLQKTIK